MSHFRLVAAVIVAFTFSAEIDAAPKVKRTPQLEKAREAYETAVSKEEETLIARFDKEVELMRTRRIDADEQQKMLDVLRWEKADFEATRALPWSAPMRPAMSTYFRDTASARGTLKKAYDRAIAERYKAKDDRGAEELLADFETLAPVRLVATWVGLTSSGEPGINVRKFYSDGTIRIFNSGQELNDGSTFTWSLEKNDFLMTTRPGPESKASTRVHHCTTAADVQTFTFDVIKGRSLRWKLMRESKE